MNNFEYYYTAKVLRIVDGDTLDLMVNLGFGVYTKQRIRLYGINTPETYGVKRDSEEYKAGIKAKDFVEQTIRPISGDKEIVIQTIKDKTGKYGRYLANVYYKKDSIKDEKWKWIWLNQELVNNNLAEVIQY